jgi:preprotein translocase subunit Sss1
MNTSIQKMEFNPLLRFIKQFLHKMVKPQQEEYPVKYYKKTKKA